MAKEKQVTKVFVYLIRFDGEPRLLVMDHDKTAGRYEVVRGKVEKDDRSLEDAARRELWEESGIDPDSVTYIDAIGQNLWQPPGKKPNRLEEQHALVFRAPDGLPEHFDHIVQSDAGDHGRQFSYHWLPVTPHLMSELTEGCDYFVAALLRWFNGYEG